MRGLILLLALLCGTSSALAQTSEDSADVVDAKPLVRIPPVAPYNATYSGYCCMTFDVSRMGRTRNVEASCSAPFYTDAAKAAVKTWTYEPKRIDGHRAVQKDVETLLNFILTDENNDFIKDPNGFPDVELRDGHVRPVLGKRDQLCPVPGVS